LAVPTFETGGGRAAIWIEAVISVQVYWLTERDMAVYGYCRVSTDRQAGNGESLGAQRRTMEGYAMMMGMKIDQMFVERGVSGSKPLAERPESSRLLAALQPNDVALRHVARVMKAEGFGLSHVGVKKVVETHRSILRTRR
jgi:Resolvase, N terminal domain